MNFFINKIKKSRLKGYLLNNTILNTIHLELWKAKLCIIQKVKKFDFNFNKIVENYVNWINFRKILI